MEEMEKEKAIYYKIGGYFVVQMYHPFLKKYGDFTAVFEEEKAIELVEYIKEHIYA